MTLLFLLIGCLIDVCFIKLTKGWVFFRAYLWLFIVNSLIAAYGFLIVVLCIDRYVALNKPLYYRIKFVKLKVRILLVLACLILAGICCVKWLVFNKIDLNSTYSENELVTSNAFYIVIRTLATIIQYFFSGVIMVVLTVKNALKLRALDKAHFNELRMSENARIYWTKNHKTTANICIFLAFSYIFFNWPYAMTDYFYTDKVSFFCQKHFWLKYFQLFEKTWYGLLELLINLSQVLYIQLNLLFFAYCSRTYRAIILQFCKNVANLVKKLCSKCKSLFKRIINTEKQLTEKSSTTSTVSTFIERF